MGVQLRDELQNKDYRKKVKTDDTVTLGNKPKRTDIESAYLLTNDELPAEDISFKLSDKKGNIFNIEYVLDEDSYYYAIKTLVDK